MGPPPDFTLLVKSRSRRSSSNRPPTTWTSTFLSFSSQSSPELWSEEKDFCLSVLSFVKIRFYLNGFPRWRFALAQRH
jgi:hypothetical protein